MHSLDVIAHGVQYISRVIALVVLCPKPGFPIRRTTCLAAGGLAGAALVCGMRYLGHLYCILEPSIYIQGVGYGEGDMGLERIVLLVRIFLQVLAPVMQPEA